MATMAGLQSNGVPIGVHQGVVYGDPGTSIPWLAKIPGVPKFPRNFYVFSGTPPLLSSRDG